MERLGQTSLLDLDERPHCREELVVDEQVNIPVQLNGKVRVVIEVPVDTSKEDLEKIALSNEKVAKAIGQSTIKKIIFIPNKFIKSILQYEE